MSAVLLDGKACAQAVRAELKEGIQTLAGKGVRPGLAVILVGDNPASASYVASKTKACTELGMLGETLSFPERVSQDSLLGLVAKLNADTRYHGVLIQLPLPSHLDSPALLEAIAPEKDVDCLHPHNVGRLLLGRPVFAPCTPAGIIELLVRNGIEVSGKHVVIVGRSNIVGKPLAAMLIQKARGGNATVTLCHTGSGDLSRYTRSADILVAAMGKAEFIRGEMIKPGAVVVDVGMNRIPDSAKRSGYRLVGDVHFDSAKEVASAITPVPGGVGPMTVTMLVANTVKAATLFAEGRRTHP
jgi:methylenetetrahydrofolate dehydrogenase (NADP+)/methenyltetrahydrofolate cyclohydrolase